LDTDYTELNGLPLNARFLSLAPNPRDIQEADFLFFGRVAKSSHLARTAKPKKQTTTAIWDQRSLAFRATPWNPCPT
jgi:hypothetical protein